MREDSFERDIAPALRADDPGPAGSALRARISAIPEEFAGRRRGTGMWTLRPARRGPLLVPLGAILVVAVLATVGLLSSVRNSPNAGPGATGTNPASPSSTGSSTPVPSAIMTATVEPTASTVQSTETAFTARGAASSWTGFSWTAVPDGTLMRAIRSNDSYFDPVRWAHGYAAIAGTMAANGAAGAVLVTSPDGETWTQVAAVPNPAFVAAGPHGLVAVSIEQSSESIWTSTDGVAWRDAGGPSGVDFIGDVAGTEAGLVAIVSERKEGVGSQVLTRVAFSSDGVSWTPVPFESGRNLEQLSVQSNGSRFFITGGYTVGAAPDQTVEGGIWWSDDGRTWTRSSSSGYRSGCVASIEFANDGMILWTNDGMGDGAALMEVSHDGGKTWLKDATFGPLGGVDAGSCEGSDGFIHSNGTTFLAVSTEGNAWTSSDGSSWKQIAWNLTEWSESSNFIVLPRGVMVGQRGPCGSVYCGSTYYGSATGT
jgi:hypothetical protein